MPQTEEEHMVGLEEENESVEGHPGEPHRTADPDAEVLSSYHSFNCYYFNLI